MRYFSLVILNCTLLLSLAYAEPSVSINQILQTSWQQYKVNKIDPATNRPLADLDKLDLANGSKGMYLTFSETVSYVMYRAVLINDRETFDRTWSWTHDNLQRKNLGEVYDWYNQKWIPVPEDKRDHLFAWRYTPNIVSSNRGGIIYYYWKPETDGQLWRDGSDVAPDGDQLIAGALLMAHVRWGSGFGIYDYKNQAKNIINDLWEKTVNFITPGELVCSTKNINYWFNYHAPQGTITLNTATNALQIEINNATYAGIGKVISDCDLNNTGPIKVLIKGCGLFRIILEDNEKRKYRSVIYSLNSPDNFKECVIEFSEPRYNFNLKKTRIVMLDLSNGSYELSKITLGTPRQKIASRYHLFSNDKNMPWINASYYMPFLYRIFAKVDPAHPWNQLAADAYQDIKESMYCRLSNDQKKSFAGKGILMPNWFSYNEMGEIVDLPWAVDNYIDDYMSGWDAFRSWYFMAMDKHWHQALEPESFLQGETYKFFKTQLDRYGYIRAGYTISGEIKNANWVDQNCFGMNGAYLTFFAEAQDQVRADKILTAILNAYNPAGFWENKLEYYKQNWVWFGLAYKQGLGDDIFAKINEQKEL